jgi:hypothetical protein
VVRLAHDEVSDEVAVQPLDDVGVEIGGLRPLAATAASLSLKRAAAWT